MPAPFDVFLTGVPTDREASEVRHAAIASDRHARLKEGRKRARKKSVRKHQPARRVRMMTLHSAAHLRLLATALLLATGAAQSGEDVCEGHGYNRDDCDRIGCCHWDGGLMDSDEGECWSA